MAKTRKFGRAEVEVSIRDRVSRGLKAIEARMTKFGSGLARIGGVVAGVGTAGVAAFGGIARQFASIGDDMQKMGIRTQASAAFLSEMGFAAQQSGTSLNQLGSALFRMNRRVANATSQTGPAVRALEELGISAQALNNLSTEERFLALADALSGMENQSRAAQLGFELFGDNFKQLQPLLAEGADGINALRQEARDLGATMTNEDADAAAKLTDAMGRITSAMRGATIQIGAALAPMLERLGNVISRTVGFVVGFIRDNRELIRTIFLVSAAVAGIGTAMVAAGGAIVALGVVIGSITTIASAAFSALAGAVALVTSPITLVVAAIAGLSYLALEATGGLQTLSNMFVSLSDTATTAWGGIVAAISNGDLQTAGEIAFLALEIAYMTVMTRLKEAWNGVVFFLQSTWQNAVKSIVEIGAAIFFGVSKQFDKLSNALVAGFDIAFIFIQGAIDQIITSIGKAIIDAQRFFRILSQEDAKSAKQVLDDSLARRAGDRQAGLDTRAADRQAGLDNRDAARRATAEAFGDALDDQFRATRGQVDRSGLDEAQQRLAEKQAALADKSAKAQDEFRKAQEQAQQEKDQGEQLFDEIPQLAAQAGGQANKAAAIGTSSAAAIAAGALGFDARPMESIDQSTRQMVGLLRRIEREKQGLA